MPIVDHVLRRGSGGADLYAALAPGAWRKACGLWPVAADGARVLGRGHTQAAGDVHAEVMALRRAFDDLECKVQERTAQLAQANAVLRTEKELFRVTLASIGDAVITTDAIAACAYTLWEQSGRPHGRDTEFWFQAEQKLKQETRSLAA